MKLMIHKAQPLQVAIAQREHTVTAVDVEAGRITMELVVTPEMEAKWDRSHRRRTRMARKKRRGW